MLTALNCTGRNECMFLSVGPKEVGLYYSDREVIERKVPLPVKWIKGLTTAQIYQSATICVHRFNCLQLLQLFQTVPKGEIKADYYLTMRGTRPAFSPVKSADTVVHRWYSSVAINKPLFPYADELHRLKEPLVEELRMNTVIGSKQFIRLFEAMM